MKKLLLPLVLLLNILMLHAKKLNIIGKVSNLGKKPVEDPSSHLLKQKDSSIINYIANSLKGNLRMLFAKYKNCSINKINTSHQTLKLELTN